MGNLVFRRDVRCRQILKLNCPIGIERDKVDVVVNRVAGALRI
jgi:hypothetical protein